jgi:RNA polymerase sigma-70 factor (ECF subfamily)
VEDHRIVELYLHRDEAAIGHTAEKYGSRLRSLSMGIVDDEQTAEECENDTYLQAWNRIPPHEPYVYLFAFLARIIRNLSIDRCRSRERHKRGAVVIELSVELENCIPAPDDVQCRMDARELADIISGFLREQTPMSRDVFLRRYWFADSVQQIAQRYHVTQSKVKSMLFRTRNALREHLKREGYVL